MNTQQQEYRKAKEDWFEGYTDTVYYHEDDGVHFELIAAVEPNEDGRGVTVNFAFYRLFQISGQWELSCENQMTMQANSKAGAMVLKSQVAALMKAAYRNFKA